MNLKNRPYLEVKVVKVKKEKIDYSARLRELKKMMLQPMYMCYVPDIIFELKEECENKLSKPKGNWVNSENLDKIKFPCWCRYLKDRYGIITKTYIGEDKETIYTVHGIERQYFSLSSVKSYNNLGKLIKAFDIHILKGKIILFEEDTNEKYDIDIEGE